MCDWAWMFAAGSYSGKTRWRLSGTWVARKNLHRECSEIDHA
jgi:hypothetical protein